MVDRKPQTGCQHPRIVHRPRQLVIAVNRVQSRERTRSLGAGRLLRYHLDLHFASLDGGRLLDGSDSQATDPEGTTSTTTSNTLNFTPFPNFPCTLSRKLAQPSGLPHVLTVRDALLPRYRHIFEFPTHAKTFKISGSHAAPHHRTPRRHRAGAQAAPKTAPALRHRQGCSSRCTQWQGLTHPDRRAGHCRNPIVEFTRAQWDSGRA